MIPSSRRKKIEAVYPWQADSGRRVKTAITTGWCFKLQEKVGRW